MPSGRDRTLRGRKDAYHGVAMAAVLCLGLAAALPLNAQDLDWAKRAGGTNVDRGNSIARDGAGNSYVTGQFFGTATFGPGEGNQTTLTAAGSGDIFVARYDASGNLVWAKRAGGTSIDQGSGIVTDGAANSFVTGFFRGTAIFGAGEPNQTTLTAASDDDIFVAKYDANGALVWAKRAGGFDFDRARAIATDGAGNSYVTGSFEGTATFGPGEPNQTMLSGGAGSIFVAKYNSGGSLLWAKSAGSFSSNAGLGIATDAAGNSFVTGTFASTATFGPGESNETTLTSAGFQDIFVAKYDPSGALVWAKRAGGAGGDQGLGIATDGAGNGYVTGLFPVTATFGPGESNETTLTSAGFQDIFVAKYDPSGALVWAKRAGGADGDQGRGIATDGAGNSYVTGSFGDTATFGPGEGSETPLTSAGFLDMFVAKYDPSGALVWAKRAGGASDEDGLGIATDSAGDSYVTGWFFGTATFGPGEANETMLTAAGDRDIFVARFADAETEVTLTAEKDSLLRKGNPDRNEGANPGLRIQASGDNRVVVGFDPDAIDDFGNVSLATLVLTIAENADNWGKNDDRTVDAHPLSVDFAEGDGQNAGVPGSEATRGNGPGVTWKCAVDAEIANQRTDCDPRWNGGDFGAATADSVIHFNGLTGEVSWDVTDDVLAGAGAWLIKKTSERQSGKVSYYSREGAADAGNPDLAPRLILER